MPNGRLVDPPLRCFFDVEVTSNAELPLRLAWGRLFD